MRNLHGCLARIENIAQLVPIHYFLHLMTQNVRQLTSLQHRPVLVFYLSAGAVLQDNFEHVLDQVLQRIGRFGL